LKSKGSQGKARKKFPVTFAILVPFLALSVTQVVDLARANPHTYERIPQVTSTFSRAITMLSPYKGKVFAPCR